MTCWHCGGGCVVISDGTIVSRLRAQAWRSDFVFPMNVEIPFGWEFCYDCRGWRTSLEEVA
jgi:hypothetical protein